MKSIDAKGLACPKPVILAKKALDQENEILIIVDNETAKENLIKLANSMNAKSSFKEVENMFEVTITKSEDCDCEVMSFDQEDSEVVLIKSEFLGSGDDELGKILMKGFIYTLSETKPYPKAILFVNAGVKLTTINEETIKNLKILQENGCKIMSCGTCLDFYNIKDKLQVGVVSNMYDIVETLKSAKKSITI